MDNDHPVRCACFRCLLAGSTDVGETSAHVFARGYNNGNRCDAINADSLVQKKDVRWTLLHAEGKDYVVSPHYFSSHDDLDEGVDEEDEEEDFPDDFEIQERAKVPVDCRAPFWLCSSQTPVPSQASWRRQDRWS